jgi:glutaredoxin
MKNQQKIIVFSTTVCPKCRRLKQHMKSQGIIFSEMDMESPEGKTELLFAGVFALEAPVLQVGNDYYTTRQLFQGIEIKEEIKSLLRQFAA